MVKVIYLDAGSTSIIARQLCWDLYWSSGRPRMWAVWRVLLFLLSRCALGEWEESEMILVVAAPVSFRLHPSKRLLPPQILHKILPSDPKTCNRSAVGAHGMQSRVLFVSPLLVCAAYDQEFHASL